TTAAYFAIRFIRMRRNNPAIFRWSLAIPAMKPGHFSVVIQPISHWIGRNCQQKLPSNNMLISIRMLWLLITASFILIILRRIFYLPPPRLAARGVEPLLRPKHGPSRAPPLMFINWIGAHHWMVASL